jgi:hypothetical protein
MLHYATATGRQAAIGLFGRGSLFSGVRLRVVLPARLGVKFEAPKMSNPLQLVAVLSLMTQKQISDPHTLPLALAQGDVEEDGVM